MLLTLYHWYLKYFNKWFAIAEDPYNVQPGLCVIINNTNFKYEDDLPGDKDEQDLFKLFFSLRFKVKIHRNLMANEMVHKVESYSKFQHTEAFFLIILSHAMVQWLMKKKWLLAQMVKQLQWMILKAFFMRPNVLLCMKYLKYSW